jgi:hypothetical protein
MRPGQTTVIITKLPADLNLAGAREGAKLLMP